MSVLAYDAGTRHFGLPLATLYARDRALCPVLVQKACENLTQVAWTVGLFRVPGQEDTIASLKKAAEASGKFKIPDDTEPHAVAGLLKAWLRDLPQPLIPTVQDDVLKSFFKAAADQPKKDIYGLLLECLSSLPRLNFATVRELIYCLHQVYLYRNFNKMTAENIVTCIVPTIGCLPVIFFYPLQVSF